MRVLVISDTHIPVVAKELPGILIEEAKKSDCCIHAGDFISSTVLHNLSKLIKTYGVYGNMDNFDLREKLPEKIIIELESVKIGLIHGRGSPAGLLEFINKEFASDIKKLDIVVFGHTHHALDKEIDGRIYFNPGSATDRVFAPNQSYGILEIEGKIIKRRIVKIE